MKVTVKRVETEIEVEGAADEIRTGVPALLAPQLDPATTITVVASPDAQQPPMFQAPGVMDAELASVGVAIHDVDEPSADVIRIDRQPEPVRELGERWQQEFPDIDIEYWEDIPAEWRWPGDVGTVHIRRQPGLEVAMCPLPASRIGTRRLRQGETTPNLASASVCERCIRHVEINRREAAAKRGHA